MIGLKKKRWKTLLLWWTSCVAILFLAGCAALPDSPISSAKPSIDPLSIDPLVGKTHSFLLRFDFPSSKDYQLETMPDLQQPRRSSLLLASCQDDCFPTGITCSSGMLTKCVQADNDPCMDLIVLDCLYGCNDNQCRTEEKRHVPQSDLLREPLPLHVDPSCTGTKLGSIVWNSDGGLCRRPGRKDTNAGMLHPKSCCRRYYGVTSCVVDEGIIRPDALSPFNYVGCYRE